MLGALLRASVRWIKAAMAWTCHGRANSQARVRDATA
jgi:hypothetical protein